MVEMVVCKKHFNREYIKSQRGASMLEVVLAIAVVMVMVPFMYNQISDMTNAVQDVAMANKIVHTRDTVINYIRINHGQWGDKAEIKLNEEQLKRIAPLAHSGFIDKYKINGSSMTDVYLAFNMAGSDLRGANVARYIGDAAAIVREDGIAYSQNWAVSAPNDFNKGDLIFKISRDFNNGDKSKFLHRGTMGEDGLNQMQRDLYMNNFNIFNVGDINGLSAKITDVDAVFLNSDVLDADSVYFNAGVNMSSQNVTMESLRVNGDTSGFRSIVANKLNSNKYSTSGRLIVDRVTVGNSVNVANNLVLKSTGAKSVTGFSGISTGKLLTPYLNATNLLFYENFGLTVSGELLISGKAALKIGSWIFPTNTPPSFSKFILTRASVPATPDNDEFKKLTSKDWVSR